MAVYNVPIIPLNLRKEETIIQIAEALNYLSEVSADIFRRINNRIEQDTNHLNKINDRINSVNTKISNISGAKKAIQVFSSSKYPATDVNFSYKTIFDKEGIPTKEKFYAEYKGDQMIEELPESLQFYHLKFNDNQKCKLEGLGDVPKSNIENVNDLLLYNSGTNLYRKYIITDALKVLQSTKKQTVNEGPKIGAAPLSISEPASVNKSLGENYYYTPHLGDVPTIEVPVDLPDLPGIADDLRYTDTSDPTIAPSVITTPNIPELPVLSPPEKQLASTTENEVYLLSDAYIPHIVTKVEIPPKKPPVPPPPPQIEKIIEDEQPIIAETEPAEIIFKKSAQTEASPKPVLDNVHASLMDAIRKAGGMKKLKSVERIEQNKNVKKSAGGDLMADLHLKLLLRRKGISGTKKPNDVVPSSAMDRISAMLPPPPAKPEQSESGTTDDDWDE